jgi:salicylate hydroxylase
MHFDKVAIVGAGIAGLTAALSFCRSGIGCDVFEQAAELSEIGAGLQMSPNASSILRELKVLPALEPVWTEPLRIGLVSGVSLKNLAHVPAGPLARQRWGAPYGVLHRSTLQSALLEALQAEPLCRLYLGSAITVGSASSLERITGTRYLLIIGADGVWSSVRTAVPDPPRAEFSGNVAWRFTVPMDAAPAWLPRDSVAAFLGPASHLVAYPLRETGAVNLIAIAAGRNDRPLWDLEADDRQRRMLLERFRAWHPEIIALLGRATSPTFWPLYETTSGRWHNGRDTVLIGDAAHAMMPFAAQGAAMAIEDAFILAQEVARASTVENALLSFETKRASRVAKVKARGAFNQFAYHARGPLRIGRDIVLSLRPPHSLAADFDWLYGYRPT